MAVLPVIRDLWPNLEWSGGTRGVRQRNASGAEQKAATDETKGLRVLPQTHKSSPTPHKQSLKLRRARGRPISRAKLKCSFFHGLCGFPVLDCNGAGCETALCHFQSQILRRQVSRPFFSPSLLFYASLNSHTSYHTFRANCKGTKPALVAFVRWCLIHI